MNDQDLFQIGLFYDTRDHEASSTSPASGEQTLENLMIDLSPTRLPGLPNMLIHDPKYNGEDGRFIKSD